MDIQTITQRVEKENIVIHKIINEIEKEIVGQKNLLEKMLIGLICEGHILLEGLPGLAKTTAVRSLASAIKTSFQRIQFTPDLLPADILGTQIYRAGSGEFEIRKGPIFHNIILADEINRAPAKVQSALLEAMQEKQVTIGETTFKLGSPFLVLATQNPIEQEGTYPLPEAQIDRFMMKIKVDYPAADEEREIIQRTAGTKASDISGAVETAELDSIKQTINSIHIEEKILDYIVRISRATRSPQEYDIDMGSLISFGASPRASIWLSQAAKAHAFISGRGYVTPQDVKNMAPDILRHRIILSYEAEAEGKTADELISVILERIEVP